MRGLCLAALLGVFGAMAGAEGFLMQAPAGVRYVECNPSGESVLPNGRLITPIGGMYQVRPHPYGLAMSGDGRFVVTVSSDGPQLSILDRADPAQPVLRYIPDNLNEGEGVLDAAFMGLAVAPDNKTLFVAGERDFSVTVFDLKTKDRLHRIACTHEADETLFEDGYIGDLVLSADGRYLYACEQSHWRVLTIDVAKREVVASTAVGRYPFGLALSPDGSKLYVANVGMFAYSWLRGTEGERARIRFPYAGFNSEEMREGGEVDGVPVPGLGDPNDLRAMSVWTLDLTDPAVPAVAAKTKTGHLVGEQLEDFPAVGGSSPNSIVATASHVYVSNGSNDSITVINAATGQREADIELTLHPRAEGLRGHIPFGLALSPDEETLYIAEAGINAVAAVRLGDRRLIGRIPTAWFPSKLAVAPGGKTLFVTCAKGVGSGPNAGPNWQPGMPTSVGSLMRGYINIIPVPVSGGEWAERTKQVVRNNVRFAPRRVDRRKEGHPVPLEPGAWESPIKHVIYVAKENRTYDEVFGALPYGRGDAELCRLGRPIDVTNADGSSTVEDVVLMPNHIALAKRFAISDNFYCDSDHSADGHRWLVGTYPNEFVEAKLGSGGDGQSEGPGNLYHTGASGAIYPEDYNEAGSIWDHFARHGLDFFNFGLGFEFWPAHELQEFKHTGIRVDINYPMPAPLFENTSRRFATYNTNVPDQFRMDMFEEELNSKWLSGEEPFPQVITMMLPNDHGASERPKDGYPYWGSFMSDNDLALGRLVELVSHSPWWEETAIIVTEDDAQGYRDTVDAHRSILMVISPYAKSGYVSHVHTNFGSILKTLFLIHGLPPLNQYDAFASDLAGCFRMEPANAEPYKALPVNKEIFDPQTALDPYDEEFDWEAAQDYVPIDHQDYLDTDIYGHSGAEGHGPRE